MSVSDDDDDDDDDDDIDVVGDSRMVVMVKPPCPSTWTVRSFEHEHATL
jgi:hypothetical protein